MHKACHRRSAVGSTNRPGDRSRVLIPGCGAAYEVAALAARGCEVLAIDYSAVAIERARETLGTELGRRVMQADFFAFDAAPFDWIYERAFLAALPLRLWAAWGRRCAQLLRPGGSMAGFFFVDGRRPGRAADRRSRSARPNCTGCSMLPSTWSPTARLRRRSRRQCLPAASAGSSGGDGEALLNVAPAARWPRSIGAPVWRRSSEALSSPASAAAPCAPASSSVPSP